MVACCATRAGVAVDDAASWPPHSGQLTCSRCGCRCQYSCERRDGVPTLDWHYTHYTSRAVGKVPLIIAEATGVAPEGRITPYCTGLWNEEQVAAWKLITDSIKRHGSVPAIQLAHAGRKASCDKPQRGGAQLALAAGGWETVAPSAVPFLASERAPRALSRDDIKAVVAAFARSAKLSADAGFEVLEIHGALLQACLDAVAA